MLVQGVGCADAVTVGVVPESQLPISGKKEGNTPRSAQASIHRNGQGTDLDT